LADRLAADQACGSKELRRTKYWCSIVPRIFVQLSMWRERSRRTGSVLCWFVVLLTATASASADLAQTAKLDDAGHPVPPLARNAPADVSLPTRELHADLSAQARQELAELLARPPPVRRSLWKVDLSRHVRFAVGCSPETMANRLNVALLRLEW
jgi:hypothetical protein